MLSVTGRIIRLDRDTSKLGRPIDIPYTSRVAGPMSPAVGLSTESREGKAKPAGTQHARLCHRKVPSAIEQITEQPSFSVESRRGRAILTS